MGLLGIGYVKRLRVQRPYTQFTRNSTRNPQPGIALIPLIFREFREGNIARLLACKTQANMTEAETEELDAAIRLPVRGRTQTGQNLEVLGYGE